MMVEISNGRSMINPRNDDFLPTLAIPRVPPHRLDVLPSVHVDLRAVHVGGGLGAEEIDEGRHLLRTPQAPMGISSARA